MSYTASRATLVRYGLDASDLPPEAKATCFQALAALERDAKLTDELAGVLRSVLRMLDGDGTLDTARAYAVLAKIQS